MVGSVTPMVYRMHRMAVAVDAVYTTPIGLQSALYRFMCWEYRRRIVYMERDVCVMWNAWQRSVRLPCVVVSTMKKQLKSIKNNKNQQSLCYIEAHALATSSERYY